MTTNLSLQYTVPSEFIPTIDRLPSPSKLGPANPDEINLAIKRLYSLLSDENIEVDLPYAKWTGTDDVNWLMSVADNKRQNPAFVGFDEKLLDLSQKMFVPVEIMSSDVQKFPFTSLGITTWEPESTYLEWFYKTRGYMRPLTIYQYQLLKVPDLTEATARLLWEDELTPQQQILLMTPKQLGAIGNWQRFAYEYLTQTYSRVYFDKQNPDLNAALTWKDEDLQREIGKPFPSQENYPTRQSMIEAYLDQSTSCCQ